MNQILNVKEKKLKLKKIFKIQFSISVILIFIVFIYFLNNLSQKSKENNISNIVKLNAKLNSVFLSNNENLYLGRIKIDKIELDYFVYNSYSEENLKILPCKFSGNELRSKREYLYYWS